MSEARLEVCLRQEEHHHPDNGATFGVGDGVKELFDFFRSVDHLVDRVGRLQAVDVHHVLQLDVHELFKGPPRGFKLEEMKLAFRLHFVRQGIPLNIY